MFKNGLHVIEIYLDTRLAKFQVDISIFGEHIAHKPWMTLSVDYVIFQTSILSISRHRREIKMTFLESWDQAGSETHVFLFENTNSKTWPYVTRGWPDPSLSLTRMGQITKWLRFLNYTCKSDYKSCAACPKKNFWSSWPFVTFRDLTLILART